MKRERREKRVFLKKKSKGKLTAWEYGGDLELTRLVDASSENGSADNAPPPPSDSDTGAGAGAGNGAGTAASAGCWYGSWC